MDYFSVRNGIRKKAEKTYDIDPGSFSMLLKCCNKYLTNLAWIFPFYCPDGGDIVGIDKKSLIEDLSYEIPSLIENQKFIEPEVCHNSFESEGSPGIRNYDPFSILDYIEYIYQNSKDFEVGEEDVYWEHFHLCFAETFEVRKKFVNQINKLFEKFNLLYVLRDNGEVERVVSNQAIIEGTKKESGLLRDSSLKELIDDAIGFYLKPDPQNLGIAVEKIWDAFERAKTFYHGLDKKESSEKIIDQVSSLEKNYRDVLKKEFHELTAIGNTFRIRHHETDKIEFVSDDQREYFFNRCLSLLLLVVKTIH